MHVYTYKKTDDFKNLPKESYKLRARINSVFFKEHYTTNSLTIAYILGNIFKLSKIELIFFQNVIYACIKKEHRHIFGF